MALFIARFPFRQGGQTGQPCMSTAGSSSEPALRSVHQVPHAIASSLMVLFWFAFAKPNYFSRPSTARSVNDDFDIKFPPRPLTSR